MLTDAAIIAIASAVERIVAFRILILESLPEAERADEARRLVFDQRQLEEFLRKLNPANWGQNKPETP